MTASPTTSLLASIASGEHRVLLTRDVGLLKRREVEHGYCVRSDKPHNQLREVSHRYALQWPHRAIPAVHGLQW